MGPHGVSQLETVTLELPFLPIANPAETICAINGLFTFFFNSEDNECLIIYVELVWLIVPAFFK